MATTGTFTGTNLIILVDGKPIGHTTSCSLEVQHNLSDATNKDSAGFTELLSGLRSATLSFDGLVDYSDEGTTKEGAHSLLKDGILSRTEFTLIFGTEETGDEVFTMDAYLASISISAPNEEAVTYSGSFSSTGAITASTNV